MQHRVILGLSLELARPDVASRTRYLVCSEMCEASFRVSTTSSRRYGNKFSEAQPLCDRGNCVALRKHRGEISFEIKKEDIAAYVLDIVKDEDVAPEHILMNVYVEMFENDLVNDTEHCCLPEHSAPRKTNIRFENA